MQNRSRPFAALSLALASSTLLVGVGAPAGAGETTRVTVTITELRNAKGVVRACMTDDPELFPKCRDDAASHRKVVPAAETLTLTFENVKPGRYAIALLHDENDNGKADRALLLMPKEGFGFSLDAKVRMGPPSFKSAAFEVGAQPVKQAIRMRYML